MVKKKSKKSYFTFHRSLSIGLFILLSILVYRKFVSTPLPVQDNIKLTKEDDEMSVSSSGDNTISSNLYVNGAVRLLIILVLVVLLIRVQNYFRKRRRRNELIIRNQNQNMKKSSNNVLYDSSSESELDEVLYDGKNSYEIANSNQPFPPN